MELHKTVLDFMQERGALRYPNEACGFVVKKGKKVKAIEMPNESPNPKNQFLMNPTAWSDAEELGEILGVWHTHINGTPKPSDADLAGCESTEVPWFILNVSSVGNSFEFSNVTVTNPTGWKPTLIGRPYVYGTFDCWSLVVDYYKQNLGIELSNDYPRIKEFWRHGKPFFSQHYADEGLVKVTDGKYEDGDVLMLQTDSSGEINHVGIYIGNDQFLHHPQDRLSKTDVYGGYWLKHTVLHLRHISKCK